MVSAEFQEPRRSRILTGTPGKQSTDTRPPTQAAATAAGSIAADAFIAFSGPRRSILESSTLLMPSDRPLSEKRILIFVGDVYEDLELWYPKLRLVEAGAAVVVAGPEANRQYAGKNGYPCTSDAAIADMEAADFDGLVVPGGFMPDKLRRDPKVLGLVREFAAEGKLVAAICHGGWIPISAGVYRHVRVTGSPGIKDDLINAGAVWEDAPVVVDRHFVSSRKPDDLPEFCRGILQVMSR
jgi:protease I